MNINWKVRLKSGPFWLGVASAVIMAVFYILDLCGAAPEITGSQIIEAVRLLEQRGLRSAVMDAVICCAEKAHDMSKGKEFNKTHAAHPACLRDAPLKYSDHIQGDL